MKSFMKSLIIIPLNFLKSIFSMCKGLENVRASIAVLQHHRLKDARNGVTSRVH